MEKNRNSLNRGGLFGQTVLALAATLGAAPLTGH